MDYKKILEGVVDIINTTEKSDIGFTNICAYIGENCPELKESEDERIRKDIINFVKSRIAGFPECERFVAWLEKQGETINRDKFTQGVLRGAAINLITWIDYNAAEGNTCLSNMECKDIEDALVSCDWDKIYGYIKKKLEKQSEQKPIDKVEPKFKVGDWVVCEVTGSVYQIKNCIENLSNHKYGYELTNGGYIGSDEVNHYHLWTIQDAKEGDVLYLQKDGKEHIIIYKGIIKERFRTFVSAYCAYNGIVDAFCFADVSRYADIAYKGIMPATKEQRDTLFAKMREAGYEWDAEKKELREIKYPTWTKEDEDNLNEAIYFIRKDDPACQVEPIVEWLRTIKQRIEE